MFNNQNKIIKKPSKRQTEVGFPAGIMQNDSNVEFCGVKNTKFVIWLQNGSSHYFSDLPVQYFELLRTAFLNDDKAMDFLSKITTDFSRKVELYTYYLYGDLDSTPDIENGVLSSPENFRESEDCPSLLWNKEITIDSKPLTTREIFISDMFGKDIPDKAIAMVLDISHPHLDTVKRNLYNKAGVGTKVEYIIKALSQNIIRNDKH